MILLIHQNDRWTKNYIRYLQERKIPYCDLTIQEIVDNIRIYDAFQNNFKKAIWETPHGILDFSKISGIYHQIYHLNTDLFRQFVKEDREYVKQEWLAYFFYRINQTSRTVNSFPLISFSGILSLFPYIYHIAAQQNIKTPRYCISTSRKNLMEFSKNKTFFSKNNLNNDYIFENVNTVTKDAIAVIEYLSGAPVITHVIGDLVLSTITYKEGSEPFILPAELQQKCIDLTKALNLITAEIFLCRAIDNNFHLYGLSSLPNWSLCAHDKMQIWDKITKILYSPTSTEKNLVRHSFITPKFRPKVKEQYINSSLDEIKL